MKLFRAARERQACVYFVLTSISAPSGRSDNCQVRLCNGVKVGRRDSASLKACPFLKQILQGGSGGSSSDKELPIVIGEVIKARRVVQLTFEDHATASASVADLKKSIPKLGLSATADLDSQDDKKAWLRSDQVSPVAFRPLNAPEIAQQIIGGTQPPSPERLTRVLIDKAMGPAPEQVQ
jgi:hypothetical protein